MSRVFRDLRRRLGFFVVPSLLLCLLCYFLFHLFQGDRGVMARRVLETELIKSEETQRHLQEHHDYLQKHIRHFQSEICPDLLEEYAKRLLGYIHPDERILKNPYGYLATPERAADHDKENDVFKTPN